MISISLNGEVFTESKGQRYSWLRGTILPSLISCYSFLKWLYLVAESSQWYLVKFRGSWGGCCRICVGNIWSISELRGSSEFLALENRPLCHETLFSFNMMRQVTKHNLKNLNLNASTVTGMASLNDRL